MKILNAKKPVLDKLFPKELFKNWGGRNLVIIKTPSRIEVISAGMQDADSIPFLDLRLYEDINFSIYMRLPAETNTFPFVFSYYTHGTRKCKEFRMVSYTENTFAIQLLQDIIKGF